MNKSHTRYFLDLRGTILTVQYSTTDDNPDYVPYVQNAIDVTDRVQEVEGSLECPTTNKHGVCVRQPIPEPDPVGDILRCKAIIEAQAEAIFSENPEYIPAGHSNNWLSKDPDWYVNGTRTGRFQSSKPNVEQVDRTPDYAVLEDASRGIIETDFSTYEQEYQAIDRSKRIDAFAWNEDDYMGKLNNVKYYGAVDKSTELGDSTVVIAQGHKVEPIVDEHAGMVQNPMTGEWGWGFF